MLKFNGKTEPQHTSLFRSKTPTADLYSTQPKTLLPMRPKTPLVDTRSRLTTPLSELNVAELEASLKNNQKILDMQPLYSYPNRGPLKTNINQNQEDIFSNNVHNLSTQLNRLEMNSRNEGLFTDPNGSNIIHLKQNKQMFPAPSDAGSFAGDVHTESIYSVATAGYLPNRDQRYLNGSSYPHENCFCYECQDFENRKQDEYSIYTIPPQMSNDIGSRLNSFISERRMNNIHYTKLENQWDRPTKNLMNHHVSELFHVLNAKKLFSNIFSFRRKTS